MIVKLSLKKVVLTIKYTAMKDFLKVRVLLAMFLLPFLLPAQV
ncbi:MAG: hypothetical protein ACI94D_001006, partial [Neolewinella sp.]